MRPSEGPAVSGDGAEELGDGDGGWGTLVTCPRDGTERYGFFLYSETGGRCLQGRRREEEEVLVREEDLLNDALVMNW